MAQVIDTAEPAFLAPDEFAQSALAEYWAQARGIVRKSLAGSADDVVPTAIEARGERLVITWRTPPTAAQRAAFVSAAVQMGSDPDDPIVHMVRCGGE